MSETAFLKPREGMVVPNPKTGTPLPKDGKLVELDAFWRRRLRDGDVVKVEQMATKGGE